LRLLDTKGDRSPMRATTLLSRILGLKATRIRGVSCDDDGLVVDVEPTTYIARCSGCMCRVRAVHDRRERNWRHLDVGPFRVWLRYSLRRVDCPRCGVVVEFVPWAESQSWFSYDFEEQVAYLAQKTDKTTLSSLMRIAWRTVGAIIERVVPRHRTADPLDNLTHIGVDELSYRRHHEYVTVVIDHERGAVVWAREGKDAATLKAFFEELGKERCAKLEAVTLDLSAAYIKAVTEATPQARLIFDRFHVQRLAHDALDTVRRQQWRTADPEEKEAIKGTRFALQKNPWNLTDVEQGKLSDVQRTNRPLYRAYLLKETLATILDGAQVNVARDKLLDWIAWANRSQLPPFRKVAGTIKKYFEGIVAYVATGLSSGRSEGLNGKIRTITRRSFGFHSATSLIALITLCCGGINLLPVHR
jgi:transposase